jgi:hypothetical protein
VEQDDDDREVRPMATNAGGVVDPADLVGRQDTLTKLYRSIDSGGAKVLGDRRMGKTSMLGVAQLDLQAVGHAVVRVSAETSDPAVFGRHLMLQMQREPLLRTALPQWEAELGGEVSVNVGVASFKLSGKAGTSGAPRELDLFRSCADAARRTGPYRIIFIFDEITALARGLASDDAGVADEFFRTLRVPRQEIGNVSVVMAGSIGLHHVLHDMAVVNDIAAIPVGPLSVEDAIYLARCLLRGAGLASDREREIASAVVDQCAAVPFYIHKLVQKLDERRGHTLDRASIEALVTRILEDPADEWEMRHYDTRIDDYYGEDAALAREIVDAFALSADGLTMAQLQSQLAAVDLSIRPSRDHLLTMLYRLEADHYLTRSGNHDRMATALLRRAWLIQRRLS